MSFDELRREQERQLNQIAAEERARQQFLDSLEGQELARIRNLMTDVLNEGMSQFPKLDSMWNGFKCDIDEWAGVVPRFDRVDCWVREVSIRVSFENRVKTFLFRSEETKERICIVYLNVSGTQTRIEYPAPHTRIARSDVENWFVSLIRLAEKVR